MDERCIGDILLQDGSVSTDDIAEALAYQRETGTMIGQALLRLGAVAEERLLAALSTQLELDVLDAAAIPSDELALSRAPAALGLPLRWLAAKEAVIWFESEAVDSATKPANGHDADAANIAPPDATLVVAARNPLDPALGEFAHVVAMDSLIHYREADLVAALAQLGERTSQSMLFTFVPRTPLLFAMYQAGKLFPRSDRSPRLVPLGEEQLRARLARDLPEWRVARSERVSSGFYISHAIELVRG
jgi:hypothetical protein